MRNSRSLREFIAILVLLAALFGAILLRIVSPGGGPFELDDCYRAYARARTATDTLGVDTHPFFIAEDDSVRLCGMLRGL